MFKIKPWRRHHHNRSWFWSMVGLTGAFFIGREAGRRMIPHHNHHHEHQSSWNHEHGMNQEL